MAVFRDDPSAWQQLDLRMLQNGPISMYFRTTVLTEDLAWFSANGYRIDRLDCSRWGTESVAHDDLCRVLSFPEYYGRNLNAFKDCLGEIEVPDEGGRVLVFERFDAAVTAMPEFCHAVLDVIATQSRYKMLFGRRLLAFVQSDDPHLAFPAVGACSVAWNPRESLNTVRGV